MVACEAAILDSEGPLKIQNTFFRYGWRRKPDIKLPTARTSYQIPSTPSYYAKLWSMTNKVNKNYVPYLFLCCCDTLILTSVFNAHVHIFFICISFILLFWRFTFSAWLFVKSGVFISGVCNLNHFINLFCNKSYLYIPIKMLCLHNEHIIRFNLFWNIY